MKKTPLKRKTTLKSYSVNLKKTPLKKQNEEVCEKWKEVREIVLKRDRYKCQLCGKPGSHVHHIHLRSKRKDLLYNLHNLILLCSNCHKHKGDEGYKELTERIARIKKMTVEELLEYAEQKED